MLTHELRGDSLMVLFSLNFYISKNEVVTYCCLLQAEALGFWSQLQVLC